MFAGVAVLSTPNSVLYQIANAPGNMTMDSEQEYGKPEDCDNKEDDDFDGLIDEKDALDCPNIVLGGSSQDLAKPEEVPQTQDETGAQTSQSPGISPENSLDFSNIKAIIKCDETFAIENNPDGCNGTDGSDRILGSINRDKIRGYGGDDWINGSSGSDYIDGGSSRNIIYGHSGNDVIRGFEGTNTIFGGNGADDIIGGYSDDKIWGGPGDDKLSSGLAGSDTIEGGDGSDTITGGYNHDTLKGGNGNDIIWGGDGGDRISGGPGDDKIYHFKDATSIDGWVDTIDCGPGNDEVWRSVGDHHKNCEKVNLTN